MNKIELYASREIRGGVGYDRYIVNISDKGQWTYFERLRKWIKSGGASTCKSWEQVSRIEFTIKTGECLNEEKLKELSDM